MYSVRDRYFRSAAKPRPEFGDDFRRKRRRPARDFVQKHCHRLSRRHATAFREHHLIEGDGGSAELRDAKPHLDCAGPAKFGAKVDIEPHQDPGEAIGCQTMAAILHQRDAARLEIGRINRVIDVLIGVEIGKAHIVGEPVGKILQAGVASRWAGAFTARFSEICALTAQLSNARKGGPRGYRNNMGFPPCSVLVRQARAKRAYRPRPTEKKTT